MNDNVNGAFRYVNSAKFAIRFDRLHPGSLFKIASEPSRKINHSKDQRVYRRAQDHEGFFATVEGDKSTAAVLMPFDMVQPVKKERV
jgi:hypothetical protein